MSIIEFYQQHIIYLQNELAARARVLDNAIVNKLAEQTPSESSEYALNLHLDRHQYLLRNISVTAKRLDTVRYMNFNQELTSSQIDLVNKVLEWHSGDNVNRYDQNRAPAESFSIYLRDLLNTIQTTKIAYGEKLYEVGAWFDEACALWRDCKKNFPDEINNIVNIMV